MRLLVLLFCLVCLSSFAQSKKKVDSFFVLYFKAVDFEADKTSTDSLPKEFIECNYDSVNAIKTCFNKYALLGADFFERISKIKRHLSERHESYVITKDIIVKWKVWYTENKKKLRWSKEKNEPVLQ